MLGVNLVHAVFLQVSKSLHAYADTSYWLSSGGVIPGPRRRLMKS